MPNIHQAVLITAPAEKIYNAITSQDGLSAWWTPNTVTNSRVDSIAHFPIGPDG